MPVYVIAEMAWGHSGDFDKAREILAAAHKGGADAVGIHITDMVTYMTRDYKCTAGQTLSDSADDQSSIYDYLQTINLTHEQWLLFGEEAGKLGMDIVAMCNDYDSFLFSKQLAIKHYVVSAASFLEQGLIGAIVDHNGSVVLRLGGATLSEIHAVVDFICARRPDAEVTLLAGIQLYPTPVDELHIGSLALLRKEFDSGKVSFGLADHIDGDDPLSLYLPALALPYGVAMIEKHLTTDRTEKLEDYEAALGAGQFRAFVDFLRMSERAVGDGSLDYLVNRSYDQYRMVTRKKIVARRDLKKGTVLREEMLCFKRADAGSQLDQLGCLLGLTLNADVVRDQGITEELLA